MNKSERVLLGVFILAAILSLLGLLYAITPVRAQPGSTSSTVFGQGCMEIVDLTHYRLHIVYSSTEPETYSFSMGEVVGNASALPYTGTATTNIPPVFTTSVGQHDDFYLEGQEGDSPYQFTLIFANDTGTAMGKVSTWEADGVCAVGTSTPVPLPPTQEPAASTPKPIVDMVRSTGRVCTVRYPQIILVCSW